MKQREVEPVVLGGAGTATAYAVAAGGAFFCAIMNTGAKGVRCWGDNAAGQLQGYGGEWRPSGSNGFLQLAAGARHTPGSLCAAAQVGSEAQVDQFLKN